MQEINASKPRSPGQSKRDLKSPGAFVTAPRSNVPVKSVKAAAQRRLIARDALSGASPGVPAVWLGAVVLLSSPSIAMPFEHTGSPAGREAHRFVSLRVRLVALILLALGPTLVLLAFSGFIGAGDLVGLAIAGLLGACAALYVADRLILRRIESLGEVARRLAAGDASARVEVAGTDEIGDLAQAVNATADRLEALLAAEEAAALSPAIEVDELVLRRSFEIGLLHQFSGALQNCLALDEAYAVIASQAEQLLPEYAGAVYLTCESGDALKAEVVWGPLPTINGDQFALGECLALRDGRTYAARKGDARAPCGHLNVQATSGYVCIPLVAHGDTLGILHLRRVHPGGDEEQLSSLETGHALAEAVADHIALTLGNLRLREALRNQSIRDPLTGLFNRRYLLESMDRELSRATRDQYPLALVVVDIDHFKRFNDTAGHDAGDAVLCALAETLQAGIRGGDIACRFGGEEFLAVLPGAALESACRRAEDLRERVQRLQVMYQGKPLDPVTISVGVAVFPEHGDTFEAIFRAADAALYEAKENGRNRVKLARSPGDAVAELDSATRRVGTH